jgi:hypothetical protein
MLPRRESYEAVILVFNWRASRYRIDGHRRDLFRESKIYEWRGMRRHQSPWALGAEHV